MTTTAGSGQPRPQGRPPATDHATIERVAFDLFEKHGFEATTIDDIAAAAGIGRRTLFRYYPSKNDIAWGRFDLSLDRLREFFANCAEDMSLHRAVHHAVLDFNQVDNDAAPQHRRRMQLILTTPALQAHSSIRYIEWRQVVAEFVAARMDCAPTDPYPQTVGHIALALALAAYEQWLKQEDLSLAQMLTVAFDDLQRYASPSSRS